MIQSLSFSLLSPDDIIKQAVTEITTSTLYIKGLPKAGGPNDIRLGTCNRRLKCSTCHQSMLKCNGHDGYLKLPVPIYHYLFIPKLIKILRCICSNCYQLVAERRPTLQGDFENIYKYMKSRTTCVQCKAAVIKYNMSNHNMTIKPTAPQDALTLLQRVNKDVFNFLGIKRPTNMILTHLLVPSVMIRPAIMFSQSTRTRGEDDLTMKIQDIIKLCKKIERKGISPILMEKLEIEVSTYFNNQSMMSKKHSGIPTKSLKDRLHGKNGRMRSFLMGKRVNYSARTVISPGVHINVNQVGVPAYVATKLTIRERVTRFNLNTLYQCVLKGPNVLGGAHSIIRKRDKRTIRLGLNMNKARIELGDEVERYLRDGDVVVVNRQPTLRRKSIMAHYVKIVPTKTFQLHLSCTSAYNADFDGKN